MKSVILKITVLLFVLKLYGCANQAPPPGGPDDKTPPVVLRISPVNETLNFRNNKIIIEFDEYIDRRSFMDAFFITPKPDTEVEFNFGGKDVEIEFPGGFEQNTTYNITVTKDLKDIRGNTLDKPIIIAFSTGNKIDKGSIEGQVFPVFSEVVSVFAYDLNRHDPNILDPSKIEPDFISQTDNVGKYAFLNLPQSEFRFFAILDKDRNSLLDSNFEQIAVTFSDFEISDSLRISGANFLMEELIQVTGSREFLNLLKADSAQRIFSSINNNDENVSISSSFYFYFRNNTLSRFDIANNLSLRDTSGNSVRVIYNWYSDSLLQIMTAEPLRFNTVYQFNISLPDYKYLLNFKTVSESRTGKILGRINSGDSITSNVVLNLIEDNEKIINFRQVRQPGETLFEYRAIPTGNYRLFAFIDSDNSGNYTYGSAFPFIPGERFIYYEPLLNIKPNWTIDNVFLNF